MDLSNISIIHSILHNLMLPSYKQAYNYIGHIVTEIQCAINDDPIPDTFCIQFNGKYHMNTYMPSYMKRMQCQVMYLNSPSPPSISDEHSTALLVAEQKLAIVVEDAEVIKHYLRTAANCALNLNEFISIIPTCLKPYVDHTNWQAPPISGLLYDFKVNHTEDEDFVKDRIMINLLLRG